MKTVGVLGCGVMGEGLVGCLRRAGFNRTLFDVRHEVAQRVAAAHSCQAVASLAELRTATPPCDVVLSCLPSSVEVEKSVDTVLSAGGLKTGTVWLDCTSGNPSASRKISSKLQSTGCHFVDVGMSGGKKGAQEGTLTLMVGGDAQVVESVKPVLSSFSKKILHVGPVGTGHAVKAVNNALMASNLLAAGEGMVILAKQGVDPKVALSAINEASGRSWATLQRFPDHVLTGKYDYGFQISLLNKDILTALNLATTTGIPAPLLHHVSDRFLAAQAALGPTEDHTGSIFLIEQQAGTSLSKPAVSTSSSTPPVSKMGIKLAVFDMAGTTVDEGAVVYTTLVFVLNKYGCNVDFHSKEFEVWHGANKVEALRHFINKKYTDGADHEKEVQEAYQLFQDHLVESYFGKNSQIKPIEGAVKLFDALRAAGIKVAVNTGYPRKLADGLIDKLAFRPHLDGSVVSEEVGQGRPYPYMIHSLMKTFGVLKASEVMKVGDTTRDIEEGKNAGCGLVIGVLSGADSEEGLLKAGADLIIPSVAHIAV